MSLIPASSGRRAGGPIFDVIPQHTLTEKHFFFLFSHLNAKYLSLSLSSSPITPCKKKKKKKKKKKSTRVPSFPREGRHPPTLDHFPQLNRIPLTQHVHIIPTIIVIPPPHPAREPVIHHHRPALGDVRAVLRLRSVQRQRAHFDGAGLGVDEWRHAEELVEQVQGGNGEPVEDDGEEDEEVDGWTGSDGRGREGRGKEKEGRTYWGRGRGGGWFLRRRQRRARGRGGACVRGRRQRRCLWEERSVVRSDGGKGQSGSPMGPKYPMNSASLTFLHTFGMNLYAMRIAGMRRKTMTRKPRPNRRPYVMPVTSGWWNSSHESTAPMYMKPPKLSSTSMQELTSSWRASVSSRYPPSQFSALPAKKQASRSSVPRAPQVPTVKSWWAC